MNQASASLDVNDVAAFLEAHRDFFQQNEHLLEKLTIPHPQTGEAVSLLERLVQRQREQQTKLQQQMDMMLKAARDSERLVLSLHNLALELLRCKNTLQVVDVCCYVLKHDFKADNVVFRLIGHGADHEGLNYISPDDRALKQLAHLFIKRQPVCGRLRPRQQAFLFGAAGETVKSAVLIPLYDEGEIGVLALGSESETRFYPGMGTLFINQLGGLVARALAQHTTLIAMSAANSTGT